MSFFYESFPYCCVYLQHWNSQKSLSSIWQHFSCLLDEWIEKICKKNHGGFFFNPLYLSSAVSLSFQIQHRSSFIVSKSLNCFITKFFNFFHHWNTKSFLPGINFVFWTFVSVTSVVEFWGRKSPGSRF